MQVYGVTAKQICSVSTNTVAVMDTENVLGK
jgi:hypothetical protein